MSYPVDLALDQWRMGQSRVIGDPDLADASDAVLAELRKRLGGVFQITELADLYGEGTDSSWAIDAAFARYAQQAADFAGGRMQRFEEE